MTKVIRVLAVENGNCLAVFDEHAGDVTALALCDSGRYLASGSEDETVREWDMREKRCIGVYRNFNGCITSIASYEYSDGKVDFAIGASEKSISLIIKMDTYIYFAWSSSNTLCLRECKINTETRLSSTNRRLMLEYGANIGNESDRNKYSDGLNQKVSARFPLVAELGSLSSAKFCTGEESKKATCQIYADKISQLSLLNEFDEKVRLELDRLKEDLVNIELVDVSLSPYFSDDEGELGDAGMLESQSLKLPAASGLNSFFPKSSAAKIESSGFVAADRDPDLYMIHILKEKIAEAEKIYDELTEEQKLGLCGAKAELAVMEDDYLKYQHESSEDYSEEQTPQGENCTYQ